MYEENYPSSIFIIKKLIDLENDNTINLTPGKDINKIYDQLRKNYWQVNSWEKIYNKIKQMHTYI